MKVKYSRFRLNAKQASFTSNGTTARWWARACAIYKKSWRHVRLKLPLPRKRLYLKFPTLYLSHWRVAGEKLLPVSVPDPYCYVRTDNNKKKIKSVRSFCVKTGNPSKLWLHNRTIARWFYYNYQNPLVCCFLVQIRAIAHKNANYITPFPRSVSLGHLWWTRHFTI